MPRHARTGGFRAVPNISVPCPSDSRCAKYFRAMPCQELGTKILIPRSWYQDLRRDPRQEVWGAGSPPRNSRGSGRRQPPSKNNFMDPGPHSDHLQPLPTICQLPSTTFRPPTAFPPPSGYLQPLSTTFNLFQPPSNHLQPPSNITIF